MQRYGVRPFIWLYVCPSVYPSMVCPSMGRPAAADLLLWSWRAGDIDWLQQLWHVAGKCGQCHIVVQVAPLVAAAY